MGAVLAVGGAGLKMFGQYKAGKAGREAGRYESRVAANNAITAGRMATDAIQRGEVSERRHRASVGLLKGSQRAATASRGIVLDTGSSLDILLETAEIGELDALTIRANAKREAQGFTAKAVNFRAQGALSRARGRSAYTAGLLGALSTGVGAGAQLLPGGGG